MVDDSKRRYHTGVSPMYAALYSTGVRPLTWEQRSTTIRATLDDGRGGDGDPLQSEKDAAAACGEGGKRQRRQRPRANDPINVQTNDASLVKAFVDYPNFAAISSPDTFLASTMHCHGFVTVGSVFSVDVFQGSAKGFEKPEYNSIVEIDRIE
uniref:Genomic DNA, chromosome 3, clone:P0043E01 n=1 Tax=Oryza sativa subsp. japonica TaxID=39947 RepID=Q9SNJ8_ORYSJ|nr:unnamed protein product [Oryza sativa Japonica Group]